MPTCFSVLVNVNAENKNLRSAHATGNVMLWRHRVQGQVTSSQGNRSQGNSLWIRGLTNPKTLSWTNHQNSRRVCPGETA